MHIPSYIYFFAIHEAWKFLAVSFCCLLLLKAPCGKVIFNKKKKIYVRRLMALKMLWWWWIKRNGNGKSFVVGEMLRMSRGWILCDLVTWNNIFTALLSINQDVRMRLLYHLSHTLVPWLMNVLCDQEHLKLKNFE